MKINLKSFSLLAVLALTVLLGLNSYAKLLFAGLLSIEGLYHVWKAS